jgi:2-(1,2-epoxy-1,2-dihydrophenyl)acetyl-CoA isomerase
MTYETIKLDIEDNIAVLALNQPQSRNGLTTAMQEEMLEALMQLHGRRDVHALILTGTGQGFCAGADLGKLEPTGQSMGQTVANVMERYTNPIVLAIRNAPFPVIAAVNGAAAGAGVGLALAADVTIAARSAFFLLSFLPRLGIVPDMGASWFLNQSIGHARAMGLMLLGERLSAEKAEQWGLIWSCVEDESLMEQARSIARQLARAPAHAPQEARRVLAAAAANDLPRQLEYERGRQCELLNLPEFREGMDAFLSKREPVFR